MNATCPGTTSTDPQWQYVLMVVFMCLAGRKPMGTALYPWWSARGTPLLMTHGHAWRPCPHIGKGSHLLWSSTMCTWWAGGVSGMERMTTGTQGHMRRHGSWWRFTTPKRNSSPHLCHYNIENPTVS